MSFIRHPYAILSVSVLVICEASTAQAANGTLLASLPVNKSVLLANPNQPEIYAASIYANTLSVVDTHTLKVTQTIQLGDPAAAMAIDPTGTNLYVAVPVLKCVKVYNTTTWANTATFSFSDYPEDVAIMAGNRLFVRHATLPDEWSTITPIDATTGVRDGPDVSNIQYVYGGNFMVSPDGNTLYYSDSGITAHHITKSTVTSTGALATVATYTFSATSGVQASLSHNGYLLADQTHFGTSQLSTTALTSQGSYAGSSDIQQRIAFSPDDTRAYYTIDDYNNNYIAQLVTLDTATLARVSTFSYSGPQGAYGFDYLVDSTGSELFVTMTNNTLNVYSITPAVPEPATLGFLGLGVVGLLVRRRGASR